jgi:beta-glucosidase-like glycosyl hydrolase
MQSEGLLTTAKHFPGHGDTNVDSHLDLPLLPFTRERLDTLEEYPFREAIHAGISGIMVAHMDIPSLDNTKNLPSSLSRKIVTGILKDSLGFKGLVVSDALEMQGVVKYFPNGQADVRAFLAGNDVLELSQNSARAILLIRKAVRRDEISAEEFEAKVKKILAAKYWSGLNNYHPTSTAHLTEDLNRPEEKDLIQDMSNAAVTLLKGNSASLELNPINRTAIVSIGVQEYTVFQRDLSHWYQYCTFFKVGKTETADNINRLCAALKQYTQVYVSINDSRSRPLSKLDYSAEVKDFITRLAARPNTVVCVFANPYTISTLPGIEKAGALLCGYQMTDALQHAAVRIIARRLNPIGRLPVNVNTYFPYGTGIRL